MVETLESRHLLTTASTGASALPARNWTPTDTNLYDAQNGPMAIFGTQVVSIFQAYETGLLQAEQNGSAAGLSSTQIAANVADGLAAQFNLVQFNDGLVGMDLKSLGGDFNAFVSQLTTLGMQVTASSSAYGIAEGWVPIAELPTIAQLPQTMCGSPIQPPVLNSIQGYQGTAYNEAETSLSAEAARSIYGVTGAGVTIGVLSDSVSKSGSGLTESYNSGDLSASNPVTVIEDGPNGGTDEGRAMLENIHDIAPGANLEFATGDDGELSFMQNIEALYNAGSNIIADDLGYYDEPMFQDGLIAQGVDYVTSRGAEYFSAAGNEGPDSGYLSTFRADSTTLNGKTGTFMNFNPNGGTANPLLPITTGVSDAEITFEYDQPYGEQEPAGATAKVTTDIDFYIYKANGTLVTSGTNNNVSIDEPLQEIQIPNPGSYFVAIEVVNGGPNPGHVEFMGQNDTNGAVNVSTEYGSAGGTYYPSTLGHEGSAATIGVGATPWWAPSPFVGQAPLANEPYSSSGPDLIDLSPKGSPITPLIVDNPTVTAPDGGSTSFFGFEIGTTDPAPISGEPSSSFNDLPTSQQNLNNFFGTSSATPNAAAVTALLLQENPTLNREQIITALTTSALPMNGTAAGTWNSQSGYGLVNAVTALRSIAPSALASSTVAAVPASTTPTVNTVLNVPTTVSGSSGTPTGTLDMYDISTNTDVATGTLSGGSATLSFTPTTTGAHVYLVTYSGNTTYASSTQYLVLNVVKAQVFVIPGPVFSPSGSPSKTAAIGTGSSLLSSLNFLPNASSPVVPIPLINDDISSTPTESDPIDELAGEIATISGSTAANPLLKKRSN